MKPLLLAILLGTPVILQGQIFLGSATASYSGSVVESGFPGDSFSVSSTSATGDVGGSLGVSSGNSGAGGSASIGAFDEFGPDIFQVRFQLSASAYPYSKADQQADSTAQATLSVDFAFSRPGVLEIRPFRFLNSGSIHYFTDIGGVDGDSVWEVSLNSSDAGPLFQLSGSGRNGVVTTSANLGVLQPGVNYSLSVSASAQGNSYGWAASVPGYEGLGASLDGTLSFTPVPEPTCYALVAGAGLLGFAIAFRSRQPRPCCKP